MGIFLIAWTITSSVFERTQDVNSSGYPQIVFIWLFIMSYSIAWSGLLYSYALEICPFQLRARGLMIMNLSIQCALTLGR